MNPQDDEQQTNAPAVEVPQEDTTVGVTPTETPEDQLAQPIEIDTTAFREIDAIESEDAPVSEPTPSPAPIEAPSVSPATETAEAINPSLETSETQQSDSPASSAAAGVSATAAAAAIGAQQAAAPTPATGIDSADKKPSKRLTVIVGIIAVVVVAVAVYVVLQLIGA